MGANSVPPPLPSDLHVSLVDEPTTTDRAAARSSGVDQHRGEALHPSIDRHVIDLDTALGQELLHIAVGQPVSQVPTHRQQDHLRREPAANKRGAVHRWLLTLVIPHFDSFAPDRANPSMQQCPPV